MSKSPNIFLPAIGGTALILAVAYGVSNRNYAGQEIESLKAQVEQTEARVASVIARAEESESNLQMLEEEAAELRLAAASGGGLSEPAPQVEGAFGLGRDAHAEEIAAWDVDVLPDGRGLPEGSGDVWTGEEVFVEQCASCHGDFAEGVGNWPVLAGGFDTLADEDPVKTVGSYWPHLSTVWDYVHRSMPFGNAGTLSADDTYAIVAYIMYSNDMVGDDFVLSHENFTEIEMYNAEGFVIDDRDALEYAQWRAEPCMSDCKEGVEITMRASVLDVTPDDGGTEEAMADHSDDAAVEVAEAATEDSAGGVDPALVAEGEKVFRQCGSCHKIGDGASNGVGPHLNGLIGRTVGSVDGFRYSNVFADANSAGEAWTADSLMAFLTDPRGTRSGTKMAFRGISDPADMAALMAYLEVTGAE